VRSLVTPILLVSAISAMPLAAQTRGATFTTGLSATLGGEWQLQGIDIGIVRPANLGLIRYVSAVVRAGSFISQESFSSARGFFGAVAIAAETPLMTLFDVGAEQAPTRLAFNFTLEASAYLAANSPVPQGSRWIGLAVLPSFRTIQTDNIGFTLMVGPIAFLGPTTDVRALLGARIEIPYATKPRVP
jgi:hypothetical protein